MSSAASVELSVQNVAKACIEQWSAKASDAHDRAGFRASFAEGKRKDGVSKELFEHMFECLARMNCWDPAEAADPWRYFVRYEMQPDALEKDVAGLCKRKHAVRIQLECDSKGNDAGLCVVYEDAPPVQLGVGPYATVNVAIERQCAARNYIRKGSQFSKVLIEARKTFTFKEHYDWQYTFILRYREPYYETQDLITDISAKDMTFRDPPLCLVQISCDAIKTTTDHAYFADSFLCKVSDLLPHDWKLVPMHVKSLKKKG